MYLWRDIFFAFLGGMLFLVVINSTGIQVVINLGFLVISLAFIALAFLCLVLEDRLKNASDFIKELKEADEKYKAIERPRTIILLSGNNKKF